MCLQEVAKLEKHPKNTAFPQTDTKVRNVPNKKHHDCQSHLSDARLSPSAGRNVFYSFGLRGRFEFGALACKCEAKWEADYTKGQFSIPSLDVLKICKSYICPSVTLRDQASHSYE
jgi:hypothetical protein